MSIFQSLARHNPQSPAITALSKTYNYSHLIQHIASLTRLVRNQSQQPIAIFHPPAYPFVPSLLAIWAAKAIAVPLSPLYPPPALAPLLHDARPSLILAPPNSSSHLPDVDIPLITVHPHLPSHSPSHLSYPQLCHHLHSATTTSDAMILYTSGTTAAPKGVVWTHHMLQHQLATLSRAWHWSASDIILNVLPLHHVHGIVNVVLSALYNGAHLHMHHKFHPQHVWQAFRSTSTPPPTVFMAVPAVYKKLITYYEMQDATTRAALRAAAASLRLFVCGSASLSKRDFEKWHHISGQPILERYGMTETGMTLSNLYDHREQGILGRPLPGVEAMIQSQANESSGQLLVRSPSVFQRYWQKPDETKRAFTSDGWFKTGDVVQYEHGRYKMLGRESCDIIKTGGYKVSAIEIEEVLRDCSGVQDCCVIGMDDEVLGETIVAVVISQQGDKIIDTISKWAAVNLPKYKVPRRFIVVDDFPRNVLGKVQKKVLKNSLHE